MDQRGEPSRAPNSPEPVRVASGSSPAQPCGFVVVGASATGPAHRTNNESCQDSFACGVVAEELVVIALADGAGSARHSELGSRVAVRAAFREACALGETDFGARRPLSEICIAAVAAARGRVERTAKVQSVPLRDLACTIIIVLADSSGLAVAHIGDGGVIADLDTGLDVVSAPQESEYANETEFLTGDRWQASLRVTARPGSPNGLLAFSDGCQRAALRNTGSGPTAFAGFCAPLLKFLTECEGPDTARRELHGLLDGQKLAGHSGDDKTLVMVVRKTTRPESEKNPPTAPAGGLPQSPT